MIRLTLLLSILCIAANSNSQAISQFRIDSLDAVRLNYIDQFSNLAVLEMYKSGIPASITLAQGILETSAGSSYLARTIHNHFGLKCGTNWDGNTHLQYDDDYNSAGTLIQSCFRAYPSAEHGFADRSQFLSDPRKYARYGQLFQLHPLDYPAWARGLQSAGYSSNDRYASRLIDYIERYQLHKIDLKAWQQRKNIPVSKRITQNNGVKMILLFEGESIHELAKKAGINPTQLLQFNDNYWKIESRPTHGTRIYLQEKQTEWTSSDWPYFYADSSQPIFEIAQLLGIKTGSLKQLNGIGLSQEPIYPAKLVIQGKNNHRDKIPVSTKSIQPASKRPLSNHTPSIQPPLNADNHRRLAQILEKNNLIYYTTKETAPTSIRIHHVEKGDTLLALSRKYGITVEEIKRLNNLIEDTIQIGQQLRI